jgi:hypothetical protein
MLFLQVKCYKQKRHTQGGHTQTKGQRKGARMRSGNRSRNGSSRCKQEGTQGRTSANRLKPKACKVERAQTSAKCEQTQTPQGCVCVQQQRQQEQQQRREQGRTGTDREHARSNERKRAQTESEWLGVEPNKRQIVGARTTDGGAQPGRGSTSDGQGE